MDAIKHLKQDHESMLTETMTVQEIKRRYPSTKAVFDGLFIGSRFEGYDCLDEVAWRHGMESEDLLLSLEEAVARSATPSVDGREAAGVFARSGE